VVTADPVVREAGAVDRLLIVDDDLSLRRGLSALLGEQYQVVEAGNGEEAIDRLVQDGIDLVILDLAMPVRDGESALREMRARGWTMPVIVVSASWDRLPNARALGADDSLAKPFDVGLLEQKIEGLLAVR